MMVDGSKSNCCNSVAQVTHNDAVNLDKQEQGCSAFRERTRLHVERNRYEDYLSK